MPAVNCISSITPVRFTAWLKRRIDDLQMCDPAMMLEIF
jgi:hypothetical protein